MNTEFIDLYNRLYNKVLTFVSLRVNDPEEAKDLVSDVFLKAWGVWQKDLSQDIPFPEEQTARNFLFLIARQKMIDLWRSGRKKYIITLNQQGSPEDEFTNEFDNLPATTLLPEEIFEQNERRNYAVGLLNQLNELERELVTLRFLEEMEYKEIAQVYGINEDNIPQKISRALKKLKKSN